MEVVRNLEITLRNWPYGLLPFLSVLWACLFVCFLWVGCRCVYLQLWGIGQYMVVCVCCSLLRLPYSLCSVSFFYVPLSSFFPTVSYTNFPQGAASLAEGLSCVLHPRQVLYKKKNFIFSSCQMKPLPRVLCS